MIRKNGAARKGRCSKCVKCKKNIYNFFADRGALEKFLKKFKDLPGNGVQYLTAFENDGYIHLYSCKHTRMPYKTAASWGTCAADHCAAFEPKEDRLTIRRGEKCLECFNNLGKTIHGGVELGEYLSQFHRSDNKSQAVDTIKTVGDLRVYRCSKSAERFYFTPGIKNSRGKCEHFNGGNE